MFADLPLEEFISATAQTLQDLGNLYAAIAYLRNFEGEKHIVFFTERGLTMPRLEEDEVLASAANDARVAIDTVQTGGILGQAGAGMPDGRWNQTFAFRTLRAIAEMTGGVSSIAESGATAMARIDAVTRWGYLLGYYPTNPKWDGNYRKLEVKVIEARRDRLLPPRLLRAARTRVLQPARVHHPGPHPRGRVVPPHGRGHSRPGRRVRREGGGRRRDGGARQRHHRHVEAGAHVRRGRAPGTDQHRGLLLGRQGERARQQPPERRHQAAGRGLQEAR